MTDMKSTLRERRREALRRAAEPNYAETGLMVVRLSRVVRQYPQHGDTWGEWTFDAEWLTLTHRNTYEVDLEKCKTAAAVADWIFQVEMHGYDTAGFVAAIYDLLRPQETLCSRCLDGSSSSQRLNVKKFLVQSTRKPAASTCPGATTVN